MVGVIPIGSHCHHIAITLILKRVLGDDLFLVLLQLSPCRRSCMAMYISSLFDDHVHGDMLDRVRTQSFGRIAPETGKSEKGPLQSTGLSSTGLRRREMWEH